MQTKDAAFTLQLMHYEGERKADMLESSDEGLHPRGLGVMRPPLHSYLQLWGPQHKKDMDLL